MTINLDLSLLDGFYLTKVGNLRVAEKLIAVIIRIAERESYSYRLDKEEKLPSWVSIDTGTDDWMSFTPLDADETTIRDIAVFLFHRHDPDELYFYIW